MKRFALLPALALAAAVFFLPGCSDDDTTTNNNNTSGPSINMQFKANTQFTYTRTMLDSLNATVPGSAHDYVVDIKGNGGGLYLGSFRDWFYRIGTDKLSNEKDTLYIRTNTGSANNASFTKEVQVYGFTTQILQQFVDLFVAAFPITPPAVPGPQWDVIATFHDQDGKAFEVGKEWFIGNSSGYQLNFTIQGLPVNVVVTFKGKLEAREEVITVGSKQVKAWKSTTTITATLPLGSPLTIKLSTWFSDDPDGQIKLRQEAGTLSIPFAAPMVIPGEEQVLKSYID